MVTLFHWELPQKLQDLGGWANPEMEFYFADFARVAYAHFGDRVKFWITINEPRILCIMGYDSIFAPGLPYPAIGDYLCGHTVLKAHARAWHLYDDEFRMKQGGTIGITLDAFWFEPMTNTTEDIDAAERRMQFSVSPYLK